MALDEIRSRQVDPVFQLASALDIDLGDNDLVTPRKSSGREKLDKEAERLKDQGFWKTLLEGLKRSFVPGYAIKARRMQQLEDERLKMDLLDAQTADNRRYELFKDLLNQQQSQTATLDTRKREDEVNARELREGLTIEALKQGREVSPDQAKSIGVDIETLLGAKAKTPEEKLLEELGLMKSPAGQEMESIRSKREMSEASGRAGIELDKQKKLQQYINELANDPKSLQRLEDEAAARAKGNYKGTFGAISELGPKPATGAGVRKGAEEAYGALLMIAVANPELGARLNADLEAFLGSNPTDAEIATKVAELKALAFSTSPTK